MVPEKLGNACKIMMGFDRFSASGKKGHWKFNSFLVLRVTALTTSVNITCVKTKFFRFIGAWYTHFFTDCLQSKR